MHRISFFIKLGFVLFLFSFSSNAQPLTGFNRIDSLIQIAPDKALNEAKGLITLAEKQNNTLLQAKNLPSQSQDISDNG